MGVKPLERATFDIRMLMTEHPPMMRDPNKQAVYGIACPDGCIDDGFLDYVRWPLFYLPYTVRPAHILDRYRIKPTVYDYEVIDHGPDTVQWHVNFADARLFYGYGTGLFAQDEMQTAEHPSLGALVEALRASGHVPLTEEAGAPTPVLVSGAPRCCTVDIAPDAAAGRPRGLYGNEFSAAPVEVVQAATSIIDPRTRTNLIAIAAPSYGVGLYDRATIERILATAYTGFRAAVAESMRLAGPVGTTVVNTGYWGCGVFGGNRVLMSLLQLIAAQFARVDFLVFHTVHEAHQKPFEDAVRIISEELNGEMTPDEVIDRVHATGFQWGMTTGV